MNIISTPCNHYAVIGTAWTVGISECQSQHIQITIPFVVFFLPFKSDSFLSNFLVSLEGERRPQNNIAHL